MESVRVLAKRTRQSIYLRAMAAQTAASLRCPVAAGQCKLHSHIVRPCARAGLKPFLQGKGLRPSAPASRAQRQQRSNVCRAEYKVTWAAMSVL